MRPTNLDALETAREMIAGGATKREVAEGLGWRIERTASFLRRHGLTLTDEGQRRTQEQARLRAFPDCDRRVADIRAMLEQDATWAEVAERLGYSVERTQKYAGRHGLSLTLQGRRRTKHARRTGQAIREEQARAAREAEAAEAMRERDRRRLAELIAEGQRLAQPKREPVRYVQRPRLVPHDYDNGAWPSRSTMA
jgi:hypothetical protein